MAGGEDGNNRTILQNGVQALWALAKALEALAPTTVGVSTTAALPAPAVAGQGARRMVTDSNTAVFNAAVVGGGSNIVPVFSDGAAWRVG